MTEGYSSSLTPEPSGWSKSRYEGAGEEDM